MERALLAMGDKVLISRGTVNAVGVELAWKSRPLQDVTDE
jgi:hypothetical protein